MIRVIRETIGETSKIRIDANGAWSVNEALRNLAELDECRLDFAEQPVAAEPVRNMAELRAHTAVALCANEGLGRISDVWEVIRARAADVLNFSSYWVGSLANFHRLAHAANWEGLRVCKHTHGEFGLAAAAHHQLLLTLPNIVDGHQETASTMEGDILTEDLPIIQSADWGVPAGTGLGVTVHEGRLQEAVERYNRDGQFLPHQTEISSAL